MHLSVRTLLSIIPALALGCAVGSHTKPPNADVPTQVMQSATGLVARGREAVKRGDAVRAEQYLSMAIDAGADSREVMPLLLEACLASSHLRAALNYAEPYLLDHPQDDALRYLVATIHLGLGQAVPAKRELRLLLERDGINADAHFLLAIIESEGDASAAREHFLAVLAHTKDKEQRIEVESRLAMLKVRNREVQFVGDAQSSERSTQ